MTTTSPPLSRDYFLGDHHFGHKRLLEFEPNERPFSSIEEHDDELIKRHNSEVSVFDHTFLLGDFALNQRKSPEGIVKLLEAMNGTKSLILGNHDNLSCFFGIDWKKIGLIRVVPYFKLGKILLSHMPVSEHMIGPGKRYTHNIHGHVHSGTLPLPYINVSATVRNLTPVSWLQLEKEMQT